MFPSVVVRALYEAVLEHQEHRAFKRKRSLWFLRSNSRRRRPPTTEKHLSDPMGVDRKCEELPNPGCSEARLVHADAGGILTRVLGASHHGKRRPLASADRSVAGLRRVTRLVPKDPRLDDVASVMGARQVTFQVTSSLRSRRTTSELRLGSPKRQARRRRAGKNPKTVVNGRKNPKSLDGHKRLISGALFEIKPYSRIYRGEFADSHSLRQSETREFLRFFDI